MKLGRPSKLRGTLAVGSSPSSGDLVALDADYRAGGSVASSAEVFRGTVQAHDEARAPRIRCLSVMAEAENLYPDPDPLGALGAVSAKIGADANFLSDGSPTLQSYTSGPAHGRALSYAFDGAVYVDSSTVVLVPYYSDVVGLYDPSAGTYSDGDTHGEGDNAFARGCLLDDGTVVFAPLDSDYVGLYDPATDTYSRGAAHGEGSLAFAGAHLCPTGVVTFAPYYSSHIGRYDVSADSYSSGDAHGESTPAFHGTVSLGQPDPYSDSEYLCLVPENSANVGLAVGGTYYSLASHGETTPAFDGGCPLPGARALLAPHDSASVGEFHLDDPLAPSGVYTSGDSHGEGGSAFRDAIHLAGAAVLVPHDSSYVGLYDWRGGGYSRGPAHGERGSAFAGAAAVSGERLVFAPYDSANVGEYELAVSVVGGLAGGLTVSELLAAYAQATAEGWLLRPSSRSPNVEWGALDTATGRQLDPAASPPDSAVLRDERIAGAVDRVVVRGAVVGGSRVEGSAGSGSTVYAEVRPSLRDPGALADAARAILDRRGGRPLRLLAWDWAGGLPQPGETVEVLDPGDGFPLPSDPTRDVPSGHYLVRSLEYYHPADKCKVELVSGRVFEPSAWPAAESADDLARRIDAEL